MGWRSFSAEIRGWRRFCPLCAPGESPRGQSGRASWARFSLDVDQGDGRRLDHADGQQEADGGAVEKALDGRKLVEEGHDANLSKNGAGGAGEEPSNLDVA